MSVVNHSRMLHELQNWNDPGDNIHPYMRVMLWLCALIGQGGWHATSACICQGSISEDKCSPSIARFLALAFDRRAMGHRRRYVETTCIGVLCVYWTIEPRLNNTPGLCFMFDVLIPDFLADHFRDTNEFRGYIFALSPFKRRKLSVCNIALTQL